MVPSLQHVVSHKDIKIINELNLNIIYSITIHFSVLKKIGRVKWYSNLKTTAKVFWQEIRFMLLKCR